MKHIQNKHISLIVVILNFDAYGFNILIIDRDYQNGLKNDFQL